MCLKYLLKISFQQNLIYVLTHLAHTVHIVHMYSMHLLTVLMGDMFYEELQCDKAAQIADFTLLLSVICIYSLHTYLGW